LGVFENRVLMRIFGPKRDEVTGTWRRLHNEKRNDLYSLPNTVWVMKLRRIRWVGHITRSGRGKMHTGFWQGNVKARDQLEDACVDGRIVLKWIFS
jgi:hypothetical protein